MTTDLNSSPLSASQQARLAELLDGINEGQLFWLAGFLAGKCAGASANPGGNQYGAAYRDCLSASLTVYNSYIAKNE